MKTLIYRNQIPIDELQEKLDQTLPVMDSAYQLFKEAPYFTKEHSLNDLFGNLDGIRLFYKRKLLEGKKLEYDGS